MVGKVNTTPVIEKSEFDPKPIYEEVRDYKDGLTDD